MLFYHLLHTSNGQISFKSYELGVLAQGQQGCFLKRIGRIYWMGNPLSGLYELLRCPINTHLNLTSRAAWRHRCTRSGQPVATGARLLSLSSTTWLPVHLEEQAPSQLPLLTTLPKPSPPHHRLSSRVLQSASTLSSWKPNPPSTHQQSSASCVDLPL